MLKLWLIALMLCFVGCSEAIQKEVALPTVQDPLKCEVRDIHGNVALKWLMERCSMAETVSASEDGNTFWKAIVFRYEEAKNKVLTK